MGKQFLAFLLCHFWKQNLGLKWVLGANWLKRSPLWRVRILFWNVTRRSSVEVRRRSAGMIYRHLQVRTVSRARNQQEAGEPCLPSTSCLFLFLLILPPIHPRNWITRHIPETSDLYSWGVLSNPDGDSNYSGVPRFLQSLQANAWIMY
jgi:hypothetical protein